MYLCKYLCITDTTVEFFSHRLNSFNIFKDIVKFPLKMIFNFTAGAPLPSPHIFLNPLYYYYNYLYLVRLVGEKCLCLHLHSMVTYEVKLYFCSFISCISSIKCCVLSFAYFLFLLLTDVSYIL